MPREQGPKQHPKRSRRCAILTHARRTKHVRSMIDKVAVDSSSACAGDARNCRAIAKRQRVVRAATMCLVLCVGTLRMLGSTEQQTGADSGGAKRSGTPAIAAK